MRPWRDEKGKIETWLPPMYRNLSTDTSMYQRNCMCPDILTAMLLVMADEGKLKSILQRTR
jgi:hypothetical protein